MISGDRGGQGVGPSLPTHLFGNVASKNRRTCEPQCGGAPSCWKILETGLSNGKKYVCIPRSCLIIHVCNQGRTLCSPCRTLHLTLTLLTWRIWWAPTTASKLRMGFNLPFKWLIIKFRRMSYFLPSWMLVWSLSVQWITLQYTCTVLQNEEKSYLSVLFCSGRKGNNKVREEFGVSLSRKEIKKQRTGKHLLAVTLLQVYLCSAGVECAWVLLERAALAFTWDVWLFSVMWTGLPSSRVMKLKFISTRP